MKSTRKTPARSRAPTLASAILIERILVPVDFSGPSKKAVTAAVQVARRFKSELTLLSVTGPKGRPGSLGALELTGVTTDPRRPTREKLTEFASKAVPADVETRLVVKSGAAYREIADEASDREVDLILIATHGYSGLAHLILGSTAEKVVRHATCPVLVLRGRDKAGEKTGFLANGIRSILVTTDFSENSLSALPHAVAWAREFGAQITLVYVVPETLPTGISHLGIVLEVKHLATSAEPQLIDFRRQHLPADVKVATLVLTGNPEHEICAAARNVDADLVIMGSHGHTGVLRLLIGSVAERVVQHAPCPVLIAHQKSDA